MFQSKLLIHSFVRKLKIPFDNLKFSYSQNCKIRYNKMKTAYFRCSSAAATITAADLSQPPQSQAQQLQINFHYTNPELLIDRNFNFSRNMNEIVDVFIDRIKTNIEKELTKKMKKKKSKKNNDATNTAGEQKQEEKELPTISVEILKKNEPIHNVTFQDLLRDENVHTDLKLRIMNEDFNVMYNLPWVVNVILPSSILAGFILYPCKLELQHADKYLSEGIWYRGLMPKSKNSKDIEWQRIHEGLTYTTNNEDIGHHIKFELIPKNSDAFVGPSVECISKTEVQAGPGLCPFENRHKFTSDCLHDDKFRIVSYNILADLYADSDFTRKELFPYCPPYALHIDYRKQLFIKEILGYNSDVVCLQEVDAKVFDIDLVPILEINGFNGRFKQKGKSGEGLAMFYRKNRFDFIEDYSFIIGENIEKLEIFKNIWEKIKANEKLVERAVNLPTTVQINVLKSLDTGNYLLIANTHLYFHPDADHIRLLQFGLCMMYIEDLYKKIMENIDNKKASLSLLFCGDFNSVPECGIYKLMTEKYVDENFIDWKSNEIEAVKGISLDQSFNIQSACGCPEYTNYTVGFYGCLDYIFYQTDHLEVKEVIPFPSDEEIKTHIAIPSVVFPSDHIALVADLKFR